MLRGRWRNPARVAKGTVLLRWSAITTAVLLGVTLLSVPAAEAVAPRRAVALAPSVEAVPAIGWKSCTDPSLAYYGLQCGSLLVPLDRADPTGPKVRLALTRKLHTAATYQGVLLTNPGGPGGSGLTLPALSEYVPGNAGASYDWIGFDPRGVGASTPSLHCSRAYFTYNRPNYVPRKRWIESHWLRKSNSYAAACASTAARKALLAHLTTLDTVQDMESIRQALGAEKISYYGFSYGTYLGQVYATRYPSRVGRFVLDGVVNPTRVWYAANLDQDRAFDANMGVYWRYLAAHPKTFHLGKRWRAIKRGYYRTLRRLDRRPAVQGRLGPDELADAMLDAGYYVYDWVGLGLDYANLVRHRRGAAILARYRDSQMGDDNGFAVYNGVQCSDVSWPGYARTRADSWAVHPRAPFLTWGNTWYNSPCLTWRAPRHARLGVSGKAVTAKMLLVSETRDAATPYLGALTVRNLFPSASLVAGVGGTTHSSSLSGVACVDNSVANYLRTGVVPARLSGVRADRNCPRLLPPDPSTAGGRTTTSPVDRMSPMLRRALLEAQRTGR
jgi:pimeloyl-ACP methyl ester carboxylesterase